MTLSPVFRSAQAVSLLQQQGIWDRFAPALAAQIEAVATVHNDLEAVIDGRFRLPAGRTVTEAADEDPALKMLQDYFFLTLFLSLFEGLGVDPARRPFYSELDFCIMGTITAADNLFDDQAKMLLPLRPVAGQRYASILQLMCFERLMRRVGDRAVAAGLFAAEPFARVQRALIDQMAEIGELEGSEESGVGDDIPVPEVMVDRVHRVRGGMLFGLAFAAPKILEAGAVQEKMIKAEPAIARLGTAFQIVDDLTDFEFDLTRKSHNLLVSEIFHHGSPEAKAKLAELWAGATPEPGLVEGLFADSARAVLGIAKREARAAFAALKELGFWFPAELADEVVHAIVGLDGVARMQALAE
jgi:hypothetical protein